MKYVKYKSRMRKRVCQSSLLLTETPLWVSIGPFRTVIGDRKGFNGFERIAFALELFCDERNVLRWFQLCVVENLFLLLLLYVYISCKSTRVEKKFTYFHTMTCNKKNYKFKRSKSFIDTSFVSFHKKCSQP